MKQDIGFGDFCDAFRDHDRRDNFSYDGLRILYDWLDDIEPEYTLDVIALCCEFSEDTAEEIAENYSIDLEDILKGLDADEVKTAVLDYLNDNTTVVGESDKGIVYAAF